MVGGKSSTPKSYFDSKNDNPNLSDTQKIQLSSDVSKQDIFIEEDLEAYDSFEDGEGTASKKSDEEPVTIYTRPESVVEREIRLQLEREAELAREREEAFRMAGKVMPEKSLVASSPPPHLHPSGKAAQILIEMELREMREREEAFKVDEKVMPETPVASPPTQRHPSGNAAQLLIETELREMREREEELKRERQHGKNPDTGLHTDEGHFSEYESLDGTTSRIVSPEVHAGSTLLNQRSRSFDSLSSGHSSSIGEYSRQPVKPLVEAEEETVPGFIRDQGETPIEREIRLAQEREMELRRENGLINDATVPSHAPVKPTQKDESSTNYALNFNDPRSAEQRMSTIRLQQEVNEIAEKEKELLSAGRIHTTSEDTLDSKVTRFTDLVENAIIEKDRSMRKSLTSSTLPRSVSIDTSTPASQQLHNQKETSVTQVSANNQMTSGGVTPARSIVQKPNFTPMGKKGLMEKFLAARGKINANGRSVSVTALPQTIPEVNPIPNRSASVVLRDIDLSLLDKKQVDEDERSSPILPRKGYQPAEVKIQAELQEMQKREEELSLQRQHRFAQSQPDLHLIGSTYSLSNENVNNLDQIEENDSTHDTLYNPNHAINTENLSQNQDDNNLYKARQQNVRLRSHHLIADWERRIQSNKDNH